MMNSLFKSIGSISRIPVSSKSFTIGYRYFTLIITILIMSFYFQDTCSSQEKAVPSRTEGSTGMKMINAVMCEDVEDGRPLNEGVIFSSSIGKISCYTEFDHLTEKRTIYHCWYFKDNLSAKKMPLVLNPPHWSTYSQIQLRETDQGPWRVEIIDQDGKILQTLRFSITD
jgi:hypothetical protein